MPYTVLSHTADTGLEATASTLAGLIEELATGMFGLVAEAESENALRWIEVAVESATVEDLVVDALSALLWHSEVEDLVFCAFAISEAEKGLGLTMRAGGVPMNAVEPAGPPIKAVTYHRLKVEHEEDGWYGRVYFDV